MLGYSPPKGGLKLQPSGLGGRWKRPSGLGGQLRLSRRRSRGSRLFSRQCFFCWCRFLHDSFLGRRLFDSRFFHDGLFRCNGLLHDGFFGCRLFGRRFFHDGLFRCNGLLHDGFFGCRLFRCWLFGHNRFFHNGFFGCWFFDGGLLRCWLFGRNNFLHGCFFCSGFLLGRSGLFRSCHFVLLDQVAKSAGSFGPSDSAPCSRVNASTSDCKGLNSVKKPCPPRRSAESRVLKESVMCGVFRTQSQDRAPPVWYSITRVSKKLRSFFRSIISLIHGNGFSSWGNKASRPICVARRFAI